jgi:hypothetical protein
MACVAAFVIRGFAVLVVAPMRVEISFIVFRILILEERLRVLNLILAGSEI